MLRLVCLAIVVAIVTISCNPVHPPMPGSGELVELSEVDGNSLGPAARWIHGEDGAWSLQLIKPLSSCGRTCNSSIECTSLVPSCRFCNFGSCAATRPESETTPDAGADAPEEK